MSQQDPITLAKQYFATIDFQYEEIKNIAIQAWAAGYYYAIQNHLTPQLP